MLNPGTFIVNNYLLLHSSITLRGSGQGVTILNKPNGSHARTAVIVPGTNGIHTPEPPYTTGSFAGSISGNVMTITAVSSGSLNAGDSVSGTVRGCNNVRRRPAERDHRGHRNLLGYPRRADRSVDDDLEVI